MRISYHEPENPSFQPPSLFSPLQFFLCCQTECIKLSNMKKTIPLKTSHCWWSSRDKEKNDLSLWRVVVLIFCWQIFGEHIDSNLFLLPPTDLLWRSRKRIPAHYEITRCEMGKRRGTRLFNSMPKIHTLGSLPNIFIVHYSRKENTVQQAVHVNTLPATDETKNSVLHSLSLALKTKNSSQWPTALNYPLIFIQRIYF